MVGAAGHAPRAIAVWHQATVGVDIGTAATSQLTSPCLGVVRLQSAIPLCRGGLCINMCAIQQQKEVQFATTFSLSGLGQRCCLSSECVCVHLSSAHLQPWCKAVGEGGEQVAHLGARSQCQHAQKLFSSPWLEEIGLENAQRARGDWFREWIAC